MAKAGQVKPHVLEDRELVAAWEERIFSDSTCIGAVRVPFTLEDADIEWNDEVVAEMRRVGDEPSLKNALAAIERLKVDNG